MTIAELITELEKLAPELEVFVSAGSYTEKATKVEESSTYVIISE